MKKTLVALAALAASAAFAQSSVTLYGVADVGYGTSKSSTVGGTADKKTTGLHESTQAGNRIGFRGTEDLGGGMKAGFTIEQGISLTSGDLFGARAGASGHQTNANALYAAAAPGAVAAPTAAQSNANATGSLYQGRGAYTSSTNRQSFVSIAGGFGEVRVGYQYTNLYVLSSFSGYIFDAEASGGDNAHVWGNTIVGGTRANGLTYISPVFAGGFKATVQYGSGQAGGIWTTNTAGVDAGQTRTGVMVQYGNGPLNASMAYTSNKVEAAGTSTTAKLYQLGASYDFGVVKVAGTYNNGDDGAAVNTDYKSHQLGVSVPFGAVELTAAIGKAKTTAAGVDTADLKQNQIGAKYALSKRTKVFFTNGTTKDSVAERGAAGTNYKGTTTRFGVIHTF